MFYTPEFQVVSTAVTSAYPRGLDVGGDGRHDSHHTHGPPSLNHLIPPLLDGEGVSLAIFVPHTGPERVGADSHLAGVIIPNSTLYSFPFLTIRIMGIAVIHLWVETCQAHLGILAGLLSVLLGHGHKLGHLWRYIPRWFW